MGTDSDTTTVGSTGGALVRTASLFSPSPVAVGITLPHSEQNLDFGSSEHPQSRQIIGDDQRFRVRVHAQQIELRTTTKPRITPTHAPVFAVPDQPWPKMVGPSTGIEASEGGAGGSVEVIETGGEMVASRLRSILAMRCLVVCSFLRGKKRVMKKLLFD